MFIVNPRTQFDITLNSIVNRFMLTLVAGSNWSLVICWVPIASLASGAQKAVPFVVKLTHEVVQALVDSEVLVGTGELREARKVFSFGAKIVSGKRIYVFTEIQISIFIIEYTTTRRDA